MYNNWEVGCQPDDIEKFDDNILINLYRQAWKQLFLQKAVAELQFELII